MPRQNKSVVQKQYRDKLLDGFSLVQTEIRHATRGEADPKTRQDVLRKAAQLIRELYVLNAKLQHQNSRPGSETPPSYARGPQTPISPCAQDPYSPIPYGSETPPSYVRGPQTAMSPCYDCCVEPNGVCQVADIRSPTEPQSFATSTGYELWDANMSFVDVSTTSAYDQVVGQVNTGPWSLDHQLYNYRP
ncbi:hypothetical protein DFH29DRAFT_1002227 [Suillus ampliporus]|nr:hypothetical protein DFH29DRAFT_1002227 [Suillus ampliporus]